MLVSTMLARKGNQVFTVAPDCAIVDVVALLRTHGIGALVVSKDGKSVSGIVSERDVVREIAEIGPEALDRPVSSVMTDKVVTCTPAESTEQLMEVVTTKRIRHVPVVENGMLVGLVSIGDIVASRVQELEAEAQLLRDYISAR